MVLFLEFLFSTHIGTSTREEPLKLCGRVGKALMPAVTGAVPEDVWEYSCCISPEGIWAAGANSCRMGGGRENSLAPWGGAGMEDCELWIVSLGLKGVCEGLLKYTRAWICVQGF